MEVFRDGSKQNGHWAATGVILSAHIAVLYEVSSEGSFIMSTPYHGPGMPW